MSKLKERFPALADTHSKLEVINDVIADVSEDGGRINKAKLTEAVQAKVAELDVNTDRLVEEGQRAAAEQIASAWANIHTIKIDRNRRVPTYQSQFGFADCYFKVGSWFVPAGSMTIDDFSQMLERQASRIANAQADHTIWQEFFDRARPGLEQGTNLVALFESGVLSDALAGVNGTPELDEGEGDD